MNLFPKIKGLFLEAFSLRKYKPLPMVLRILLFIALSPFWLCGLIATAFYYLIAFLVSVMDYPVDALNGFLKEEGEKRRHGTEVVIYLVGFPMVFFCKAFVILLTTFNFLVYFMATLAYFYASMAGVTWMPFLNQDGLRDTEVSKADLASGTYLPRSLVTMAVGFLYLIFFILSFFVPHLAITILEYLFFAILVVYVPLAFRAKKVEPEPEPEPEPTSEEEKPE